MVRPYWPRHPVWAAVLFSYAFKRRIIDNNPIIHTAKPKLIDNPPEIFTVDELRGLLEAAQRTERGLFRCSRLARVAGLRDTEIKRLDWSEVDLARGHIEVKAAKAKSARRRIVPIKPNLTAWLRPYAAMQGAVVPEGARKKLERVRKAAALLAGRRTDCGTPSLLIGWRLFMTRPA
jgi:integrase